MESRRIRLIPVDTEMIDSLMKSDGDFLSRYRLLNDAGEFLVPSENYLKRIRNRLLAHPEEYPLAVDHLIVLKKMNTVIGSIYFKYLPKGGISEIGYGMTPRYEGFGYMTEAVGMMLEYGKENGITVVIADTRQDNIKSQKVLLRCGFLETGRSDSLVYFRKEL